MIDRIATGQKYGRWTVIAKAASRVTPGGSTRPYWSCRCECGTQQEVQAAHLRSGRSQSCGCLRRELAAQQKHVHGGRHTPLYEVWTQMLQRCENPRNKAYPAYGGRGITVCARWHDFAAFQADMAATYEPGLEIDRRDNDAGYEPRNCRWATQVQQSRNQRRTIMVAWEGKTVPLADLADAHGVKLMTAYSRFVVKGWTVRQALGFDAPPPVNRPPIAEETRQRMRQSAILREQRKRGAV